VDSNARHLLSIINTSSTSAASRRAKIAAPRRGLRAAALIAELLAEVEPLIQKAKLQVLTDLQHAGPLVRSIGRR